MASKFFASCCLCMQELQSPSKRRRLYGVSSRAALQSLRDEATKRRIEGAIPPQEVSGSGPGPFLCLACFQQLEKLSKVKATMQQLESEVGSKIAAMASAQNLILPG